MEKKKNEGGTSAVLNSVTSLHILLVRTKSPHRHMRVGTAVQMVSQDHLHYIVAEKKKEENEILTESATPAIILIISFALAHTIFSNIQYKENENT